jgi:type IV secretory pathway TraG/TraD family ATPase VirD4
MIGMVLLDKTLVVRYKTTVKVIGIEYIIFLIIRVAFIIKKRIRTQKAKNIADYLYIGGTCEYGIIDHPDWSKRGGFIYQSRDTMTKTIMILGDMGVGKTRLMKMFLDYAELWTDAAFFVHDPKSEWLRSVYNDNRDIIFSPYDERTVAWDLWSDLEEHPELLDLICKGAILRHQEKEENSFWINTASILLADALATGDIIKSREYLMKKREQESDNKTFLSTYATALAGFRDIVSISLSAGRKIKLDEFINNKKNKVFLVNPPSVRESNAGPLNIFLTALLTRMISLPNTKSDSEIRAMFLIDEALQFNLPEIIETAIITTARSKGISYIGSIQHLPTRWQGETHLTKAQTKYIFRCSDPATISEVCKWTEFEYEKGIETTSETSSGLFKLGNDSTTKSHHIEKRHGQIIHNLSLSGLGKQLFFRKQLNFTTVGFTKDVELTEHDEIKDILYNAELKKIVSKFMEGL